MYVYVYVFMERGVRERGWFVGGFVGRGSGEWMGGF
jgi:hypothetical protein